MTATSIAAGVGFRHARYWLLDSNGYPSGTQSGSDGYAGRRLEGAKRFEATIPDAQVLNHTGDDIVFAQDSLAPTELETATLTTGKSNLTTDAQLSDTNIYTLGELQIGVRGSDHMGMEPQVCLQVWRQALDTDDSSSNYGKRQYYTSLYPKTRIVPKGGQMSEQSVDENQYNIVPTKVKEYPWGIALSEATEGCTETTRMDIISDNPWMMERYDGDGATVNFLTDFTPISTAKSKAWVDGVAATVSAVDTSNKFITLSVAPALDAVVVIIYEASDLT